ncbi:hypothetical protein [Streptosporangium canum]|uniref:hypothetical protein n=1 Tax=Streptosporangium canum TaxID=324952 RepID=UPI0033BF45D7
MQRRRFLHRHGKLPADRAAAFQALGIVWDPHAQDWREVLADCQDFYAAHGHLDIHGKTAGTRIKALGATWVTRAQR